MIGPPPPYPLKIHADSHHIHLCGKRAAGFKIRCNATQGIRYIPRGGGGSPPPDAAPGKGGGGGGSGGAALTAVGGVNRLLATHKDPPSRCAGPPFLCIHGGESCHQHNGGRGGGGPAGSEGRGLWCDLGPYPSPAECLAKPCPHVLDRTSRTRSGGDPRFYRDPLQVRS